MNANSQDEVKVPEDLKEFKVLAKKCCHNIGEFWQRTWQAASSPKRILKLISSLESALAEAKAEADTYKSGLVHEMRSHADDLDKLAEAKRELVEQAKVIRDMPWPPYLFSSSDGWSCHTKGCSANRYDRKHVDGCPVAAFESLRLKLGEGEL